MKAQKKTARTVRQQPSALADVNEVSADMLQPRAADFDAIAAKYRADGNPELAEAALAKAAELRQKEVREGASVMKAQKKNAGAAPLAQQEAQPLAADAAILLVAGLHGAEMPAEEAGPCVVQRVEFDTQQHVVKLLGYAAAHTGHEGRGFFFRSAPQVVFVVTDVCIPGFVDGRDVRGEAARWILNFFPTFTQARRAVETVRWLPVLQKGLRDVPALVAREWELAQAEGASGEPMFVLWAATPEGRELVTEDFGQQIAEAVFGFAARLPAMRKA